jgi:hypothetical protein
MKSRLLVLLCILSALASSAQYDPAKLTYYRFKYGDRVHRFQADSVMVPPQDTTYNKTGIALRSGTFYIGNGTYWSEVTGEGGSNPTTADYGYLNVVRDFGAIGNGTNDDAAAFQAMFDYIDQNPLKLYKLLVPAGNYKFGSTVYLPQRINTTGEKMRVLFEGYGARIFTTAAITLFNRVPATQTIALDSLVSNWQMTMRGFTLEGNGTAGQVGIRVGASLNWSYEDMNFDQLDTAHIILFGLHNQIRNCDYGLNETDNIVLDYGSRWGGTPANSATNETVIDNVRVFGANGANSHLRIFAADALKVRRFTSEGYKPRYNFILDSDASTNVTSCEIDGVHIESNGGTFTANTNFKIKANGTFTIKNVYLQYPDTLFNSAGTSGSSTIIFDGLLYTGALPAVPFNADGDQTLGYNLIFRNVADGPGFNTKLKTAASWVGGVLPIEVFHDYENQSGTGARVFSQGGNTEFRPGFSVSIPQLKSYGHLFFGTDATYDIGMLASATINSRPRDIGVSRYVYIDTAGKVRWGSASVTPDVEFYRIAASQLGLGDGASGYSDLFGKSFFASERSGYTSSISYEGLQDNDWITKAHLQEQISSTGAVYIDGTILTGGNTFDNPITADTTTILATKTDLTLDSIYRTPGVDTIYFTRNGTIVARIKDSVASGGGGDDWGAMFVRTDTTLNGKGTVADTLKVDTNVVATKYYVDNLPALSPADGSETIINVVSPGLAKTGSGTATDPYVLINTGSPGSNPHNAYIFVSGLVSDATESGSTVSGTDNAAIVQAAINSAEDGQLIIIPHGNYRIGSPMDTIKGPKRLNLLILGNTYHSNGTTGVDFLIFKNQSGGFEQHSVVHMGNCIGRVGNPTHNNTNHDAGTGPVWANFTGTPFKIYNTYQTYIQFNKIFGFKNGVEIIGHDYDNSNRGSQENTVVGRWISYCANGITLTSLNGFSYVDKNIFTGWDNGTIRISAGLGLKIDGYSTYVDADQGAGTRMEQYNGAFRSNKFQLMMEQVDSVAEIHGDVTEPEFNITVEGSGVYGDVGFRMRSTDTNYVRDPIFNGRGVYSIDWVQNGMGKNARGNVPIWNSSNGRRYANNWTTDNSGNMVFIGSTMTKFQRDNSPASFSYATGNEIEKTVTVTTSTYTPAAGERFIKMNNASGTLTLPAAGSYVGRLITVKNTHSSNALTVSNTSDYTSIPAGDNMTYYSDGNVWSGIVNPEGTSGSGSSIFTDDANGKTTSHKVGLRTASVSTTAVAFPASTTTVSSYKVPTGAHPTSPADGDEWRVAKGRYIAYNGITYQILTVPDNGVAKQIIRRNAANDDYEHAYPNYTLEYSGVASVNATTTSSTGNSFLGGAKTITGGVAAGDEIVLKGSGIFSVGNVSGGTPSIDFVCGSQTIHVGLGAGYSNLVTGYFEYEFSAIPTTTGSNVTTFIHYKVTFTNGSTGAISTLQNYTTLSALNTSTPTVNAIGYWSSASNTMTGYRAKVEVNRK